MLSLKQKIDRILTAGTFAEIGEHETALTFLQDSQQDDTATASAADYGEPLLAGEPMTAREKLESHFTAAAFAEAGEFETARQLLPQYERKQAVLLAIEGETPARATFDHALNLCKRVQANIDILQIRSNGRSDEDGPSEALSALLPKLEERGISYRVTVRRARANDILYDYVRTHRNVVTAIVDSPSLMNREAEEARWKETLKDIAEKLCVPLVTATQRGVR